MSYHDTVTEKKIINICSKRQVVYVISEKYPHL